MPRPRYTRGAATLLLFSGNTSLGWRVVRRIAVQIGETNVMMRRWRRVVDEFGNCLGYQPLNENVNAKPADRVDPTSIVKREMQANAGEFGASQTERLAEPERINRIHPKSGRLLAEEDFIELARAKVEHWCVPANYHGDRAVRIYPRKPVYA